MPAAAWQRPEIRVRAILQQPLHPVPLLPGDLARGLSCPLPRVPRPPVGVREPPPSPPTGRPRVALLDGVPLANHVLLRDRIVVDDPDGWEATTPAARRVHGTSMASLVIHGDLGAQHAPLTTPFYARPILVAGAPAWVRDPREELPRDRLAVDIVHQAVARLFAGETAAAPDVRVIVLAVADAALQFDRFVSPLARLLDWLSFRYRVLFLVPAGNHLEALDIPADTGFEDPHELQHELLCAVQRSAALRRLLSPGESVNALTVGAAHSADSSNVPEDDRLAVRAAGRWQWKSASRARVARADLGSAAQSRCRP
jgi:hypothetical protein